MNDPDKSQERNPPADDESLEIEIARQYFLELVKTSVSLRQQMQQARTKTKRDYFSKKLRKNNKESLDLLSILSAVEESKAL